MDELQASATFIAGAVVVVLLTLPVVRTPSAGSGAISTFIVAITVQGVARAPLRGRRGPRSSAPLSTASSCSRTARRPPPSTARRAAEVEHDHQGLLNMALLTVGMIGFIAGVVLAAGLLGQLGFGVVLVVIGIGHGRNRRRLPAAARGGVDGVLDLLITRRDRLPGRRAAVRGRRRRQRRARSILVTHCHKDRRRPAGARGRGRAAGSCSAPASSTCTRTRRLVSFDDPFLTPKLAQGFTTEVINPDGLAPAPVAPERRPERQAYLRPLEGGGPGDWPWSTVTEYLDALDATRPALSLVPSIGPRRGARARARRRQGGTDAASSCARCAARCGSGSRRERGCCRSGSSTSRAPTPTTDELVAVAEEAAAFGAPLVPHVRNEGHGLLEAISEMIDVARRVGRSAASLPPQVARRREPDRAAARAARGGGRRRSTSPSTSTPTAPAAPCSRACSRPGRRRAARRARCRRSAAATDRRRIAHDIAHGLPGWENILGTLGPESIEIANAAPPNEDAGRPDARPRSRAGVAAIPSRRRST